MEGARTVELHVLGVRAGATERGCVPLPGPCLHAPPETRWRCGRREDMGG